MSRHRPCRIFTRVGCAPCAATLRMTVHKTPHVLMRFEALWKVTWQSPCRRRQPGAAEGQRLKGSGYRGGAGTCARAHVQTGGDGGKVRQRHLAAEEAAGAQLEDDVDHLVERRRDPGAVLPLHSRCRRLRVLPPHRSCRTHTTNAFNNGQHHGLI